MHAIDCRNHWRELNLGVMTRRLGKNPDILQAIEDPGVAREFIEKYDWGSPGKPLYYVWGLEEKIYFDKMTDAEAVFVARDIIRNYEIPNAHISSQYERWEQ